MKKIIKIIILLFVTMLSFGNEYEVIVNPKIKIEKNEIEKDRKKIHNYIKYMLKMGSGAILYEVIENVHEEIELSEKGKQEIENISEEILDELFQKLSFSITKMNYFSKNELKVSIKIKSLDIEKYMENEFEKDVLKELQEIENNEEFLEKLNEMENMSESEKILIQIYKLIMDKLKKKIKMSPLITTEEVFEFKKINGEWNLK